MTSFANRAATLAALLLVAALMSACGGSGSTTPSAPQGFDGSWAATYFVDRCTATGWTTCDGVGTSEALTLVLTQTGSGLSGTIRLSDVSIPVTGAAVNGTLSLTGHAVGSSTKAEVQTADLLQWASTLDATGAQRGTLTYRVSSTWGIAVPPPYPPFETWNRTFEGHITASCRTTDSTVTTCR